MREQFNEFVKAKTPRMLRKHLGTTPSTEDPRQLDEGDSITEKLQTTLNNLFSNSTDPVSLQEKLSKIKNQLEELKNPLLEKEKEIEENSGEKTAKAEKDKISLLSEKISAVKNFLIDINGSKKLEAALALFSEEVKKKIEELRKEDQELKQIKVIKKEIYKPHLAISSEINSYKKLEKHVERLNEIREDGDKKKKKIDSEMKEKFQGAKTIKEVKESKEAAKKSEAALVEKLIANRKEGSKKNVLLEIKKSLGDSLTYTQFSEELRKYITEQNERLTEIKQEEREKKRAKKKRDKLIQTIKGSFQNKYRASASADTKQKTVEEDLTVSQKETKAVETNQEQQKSPFEYSYTIEIPENFDSIEENSDADLAEEFEMPEQKLTDNTQTSIPLNLKFLENNEDTPTYLTTLLNAKNKVKNFLEEAPNNIFQLKTKIKEKEESLFKKKAEYQKIYREKKELEFKFEVTKKHLQYIENFRDSSSQTENTTLPGNNKKQQENAESQRINQAFSEKFNNHIDGLSEKRQNEELNTYIKSQKTQLRELNKQLEEKKSELEEAKEAIENEERELEIAETELQTQSSSIFERYSCIKEFLITNELQEKSPEVKIELIKEFGKHLDTKIELAEKKNREIFDLREIKHKEHQATIDFDPLNGDLLEGFFQDNDEIQEEKKEEKGQHNNSLKGKFSKIQKDLPKKLESLNILQRQTNSAIANLKNLKEQLTQTETNNSSSIQEEFQQEKFKGKVLDTHLENITELKEGIEKLRKKIIEEYNDELYDCQESEIGKIHAKYKDKAKQAVEKFIKEKIEENKKEPDDKKHKKETRNGLKITNKFLRRCQNKDFDLDQLSAELSSHYEKLEKIKENQRKNKTNAEKSFFAQKIEEKEYKKRVRSRFNNAVNPVLNSFNETDDNGSGFKEEYDIDCTEETIDSAIAELEETNKKIAEEIETQKKAHQEQERKLEELRKLPEYEDYRPRFIFSPKFESQEFDSDDELDDDEAESTLPRLTKDELSNTSKANKQEVELEEHLKKLNRVANSLEKCLKEISAKKLQSESELHETIQKKKDTIVKTQEEIRDQLKEKNKISSAVSTIEKHLSDLKRFKKIVESENEKRKECLKEVLKKFTKESEITEEKKAGENSNKNLLKETILKFVSANEKELEKNTKDFLNEIENENLTCEAFIKELDAYTKEQTEENDKRRKESEKIDRKIKQNKNLISGHHETLEESIKDTYEKLQNSLGTVLDQNEIAKSFLEKNEALFKRLTENSSNDDDASREKNTYLLKIQSLEFFQEMIQEEIRETEKAVKQLTGLKVLEEDFHEPSLRDYTLKITEKLPPNIDLEEDSTEEKWSEKNENETQVVSELFGNGYFQKNSPRETLIHLQILEDKIESTFGKFKAQEESLDKATAETKNKINELKTEVELSQEQYNKEDFCYKAISNHLTQLKNLNGKIIDEHNKLKTGYQNKLGNAKSIKEAHAIKSEYREKSIEKANKLMDEFKKFNGAGKTSQNKKELEKATEQLHNDLFGKIKNINDINLYALHIELERYQNMVQNPKPRRSKIDTLEEVLDGLEEKLTEQKGTHWKEFEDSLHPSIGQLLEDTHQPAHKSGNNEQRIFAKFATLAAVKDRVGSEKKKAKSAIAELDEYKSNTEMEPYEPKLKFEPAPNFSELSKNSGNETEESQEKITHRQLFEKLYNEDFSLSFLGSEENTQEYRKALLKAKKETDALLEHDLLTEKRESLDKKLKENKEEIEILESQFETAEKEIEELKLTINTIRKHTIEVGEEIQEARSRSHSYMEKRGNNNEEIYSADTKEKVDKVREKIDKKSIKATSELLALYGENAYKDLMVKNTACQKEKTEDDIIEQKKLEINRDFFKALSKLSTSEKLDERKICIELENYIKEQDEKVEQLIKNKDKIKKQLKNNKSQVENIKSEIEELSNEYEKQFNLLLAEQQDVRNFVENNKDRIKEIGEETNIPSYEVSTAAIEVFKEKLEEALKNLKDDPELAVQEKQVEEYIASRKAKKTFPDPNFDKWMHEVFEKCEWNFYQPEEKKRNTKPNARNINDTKNDETSSFSYGGASIRLVENENGGHTITTDGFDILDPQRGNVVALIYTHLLQMHHKQQFYSENIIAEKGKVSPEGKKRGFYLYRDENDKVYALVIHDDKENESLNLTEIADPSLLSQLKWPESGQKNTGDIPDKLLSLIIHNCKYEMQQGGINWANAKHQNFLLDNPKLSNEEIDEVLEIGLGDNNLDFNLFKTIPGFENVSTVEQFREKVNFISEVEKPEVRPTNIKKNPKAQAIYLQPAFIKRIIRTDRVDEYISNGCDFSCIKNQLADHIAKTEGKHLPEKILKHVINNEQVDIKTFLLKLLNQENDTAKNLAKTVSNSESIVKALLKKELLIPMIIGLVQKDKLEVAEKLSQGLKHIDKNSHSDLTSLIEVTKAAHLKFNLAVENGQSSPQHSCAKIIANCYEFGDDWSQKKIAKKTMSLRNHLRTDTLPQPIRFVLKPIFEHIPALRSTQETKKFKLFTQVDENTKVNVGHAKFLRRQRGKLSGSQTVEDHHNKDSSVEKPSHRRSPSVGSLSLFRKTQTSERGDPMGSHSNNTQKP